MSGVPVYSQSPINASKAAGVTPQTLAAPPRLLSDHPPSTTAISQPLGYPPAKPGAAIPAPTGTAQRSVPVGPTPPTKAYRDDAAPPQPGEVPIPLTSSTMLQHANLQQVPGTHQSYPYQPIPLASTRPPTSLTNMVTALPAAGFGASRQNVEHPLEHPPGYQQNTYASDVTTSDQRQAQDATDSSATGGGFEKIGGIGSESVWNTAKHWANVAGDKLSQTEAEIWRRVNKE